MSYKSSNGRDSGKLLQVFQSDKTALGQGIGGAAAGIAATLPITATGGNAILTPPDGWKYHVFTSPGTFSVTDAGPGSVELIMVGGGGGGGGADQGGGPGGGGGAGGVLYLAAPITSSPGSYPITIGPGGSGGQAEPAPGPAKPGNAGTPTVGFSLTAYGGGGGGGVGAGGACGPGGDTSPRSNNSFSPPVGWGWPASPPARQGGGAGAGVVPSPGTTGYIVAGFYLSEGGTTPTPVGGTPTSGVVRSYPYSQGHGGSGGGAPGGNGGSGTAGIAIVRYKNI